MTTILRRLPYFDRLTHVTVRQDTVRVKAHQIVLWASVSPIEFAEWDPRTSRFPVILDTGHTHNFSIQERHLVRWAGIEPSFLPILDRIRESGRTIPLRAATLWIHPNHHGTRDVPAGRTPVRLELAQGIAVYPDDGASYPRLPLLGLRAITENDLRVVIDGRRREVSLAHRPAWWPFR